MMKKSKLSTGALLGALTTLPLMALMYLGAQWATLPFVPLDVFDWLARVLPGEVITLGIDLMVRVIAALSLGETSSTAKLLEQASGIALSVGVGGLFGLVLAALGRSRRERLRTAGLVGGVLVWLVVLLIESALGTPGASGVSSAVWLAILLVGWGWALAWLIQEASAISAQQPEARMSRRQFLSLTGSGIAALSLGALGLGWLLGREEEASEVVGQIALDRADPFGAELTSGAAASPSAGELAARPAAAPGTRAELTANEDFYRIDINTRAVQIEGEGWRLRIGGLVDKPLSLGIDDLREFPAVTQILTMQCISNPIGGDLTGTSRWTGARLSEVLEAAGMQEGAEAVLIEAADGFFETVSMEDVMDERTLLVYEMNGAPLPEEHGFPLRVYIPNRYGMKQPKWIERIDVLAEDLDGYWVARGWSKEAYVNTVSVVDAAQRVPSEDGENGEEVIAVGGMAWSGVRGISKVEVQRNEGEWEAARLLSPPLSPLTWVLWRYEFPYEAGRYTFRVRAYDGEGKLQETGERPARPDGATGTHALTARL